MLCLCRSEGNADMYWFENPPLHLWNDHKSIFYIEISRELRFSRPCMFWGPLGYFFFPFNPVLKGYLQTFKDFEENEDGIKVLPNFVIRTVHK